MIAAGVLALGLVGLMLSAVFALAHEGHLFELVIGGLLLWGPIFGAIAWATRRALRKNTIGGTRK